LTDVLIHSDPAHRGGGQIIPAATRAILASQYTAKPAIAEPMFVVDVQTTSEWVSSVYGVIGRRRGEVISEEPKLGTPLVVIQAYLPVRESFGFTGALREATSGNAFPQTVFSHWNIIDDDELTKSIITEIRKRKGMPLDLPGLEKYHDKL